MTQRFISSLTIRALDALYEGLTSEADRKFIDTYNDFPHVQSVRVTDECMICKVNHLQHHRQP